MEHAFLLGYNKWLKHDSFHLMFIVTSDGAYIHSAESSDFIPYWIKYDTEVVDQTFD